MQPPISAEERGGEKDAEGLYRKEQVFILYLIQFIARVWTFDQVENFIFDRLIEQLRKGEENIRSHPK